MKWVCLIGVAASAMVWSPSSAPPVAAAAGIMMGGVEAEATILAGETIITGGASEFTRPSCEGHTRESRGARTNLS